MKISIFCHFDREKQCYLETDFSNTVNERVLSQKQKNDLLHSIAFFFKNMSSIECNYEIYDKKLFAIIRCFEKWRFEFKATDLSMKIFTDHKSLEYFMTTKKLIKRQIKWFEFLSQYNFVIMYQSDAQNVKTNALIKRFNDQSFEEIKDRLEHQIKTLLFTNRLKALSIDSENDKKENSEELTFVEKVSRANKDDEICFKIRRRLKTSKLSTTSIENEDLSNHANCIIKNELLYKKERLWMLNFDHFRLNVIRQVHDQILVKHFDYVRTFCLINQNYYWSRVNKHIKRYVRNCHVCWRAKVSRNKYNNKLNSLSISERDWQNIFLNFVVEIFRCFDRFNSILMIIDKFSKKRHYIFCDTDNDDITAKIVVKILIHNVWKLHELFLFIISNKKSQFVSIVWRILCKILNIVSKFSTVFHLEIDDQSEIVNQKIKRYIRTFCNHHQNNWDEILSMTEFAINECHLIITKIFFLITKNFNFRMNFDIVDLSPIIIRKRILKRKTVDIFDEMKNIRKFIIKNIQKVQKQQIKHANRHKKNVKYEVKNLVWISTKNIMINRFFKKLDHKMIESYSIIKIIDSFYQVQLFETIKIFDTFHFSLLRKASMNSLSEQINELSSSIIINDEKKWEMNDILNARKHYRRIQFLIKWKDHDENRTWYNSKEFQNAKKIVKNFYERYSDKSKFAWVN